MSYLSQYTGAQVDALLGKCDELPSAEELSSELDERAALTAPLYLEGAMYVAGAGFLAGADLLGTTDTEQLNASSTGNKKKAYDRFMKNVPCCLLVPVAASASTSSVAVSCIPFLLEESVSRLVSGYRIVLKYRSAMVLSPGYYTDINIVVTLSNRTVSIGFDTTAVPTAVDNTPMLPFITEYFSVAADGSVSPSSSVSFSSSSTGELKKLYDRVQKGFPPAIGVRMTNSGGSSSLVWAYPDTFSGGKAVIYMSGAMSNGTFSGKCLRVTLTDTRIQCQIGDASS